MIRFVAPDAPEPEPISGTVVVGHDGVVLPTLRAPDPVVLDERDREIVRLKLQGWTTPEIVATLQIDKRTIYRALRRAREVGALQDVQADLAHHVVPLCVERLAEKVEAGEWEPIHATLKGLGVFRTYTQNKSDSTERSVNLSVSFELPTDRPPLEARPQNILGRPRESRHGEKAVEGEGQGNPP